MKLGIYLSPRDDHFGAQTSGKCDTQEMQAAYDDRYRRQLTEVLSRYGEIFEVWFDGSNVVEVGDILKQYAPGAMIFRANMRPSAGWAMKTVSRPIRPELHDREAAQRGRPPESTPFGDVWLPSECDVSLRRDWFWNSGNETTIKSLDQLMDIYYRSVGRGAVCC